MTYQTATPALLAVGERVKARRRELGLTQAELAQQAGVSRTVVTNAEAARQGLSQASLTGFSRALGLAYADLMPEGSDLEADQIPPPLPVLPEKVDRRHGNLLMGLLRCHDCGVPVERDGSYVKDAWRYWCLACWPGLEATP